MGMKEIHSNVYMDFTWILWSASGVTNYIIIYVIVEMINQAYKDMLKDYSDEGNYDTLIVDEETVIEQQQFPDSHTTNAKDPIEPGVMTDEL